ncbi:unnamed protein product, partial [Prorocentrum cordatum]
AERAAAYARNLSSCLGDLARLHAELGLLSSELRQVRSQHAQQGADAGSFYAHTLGLVVTGIVTQIVGACGDTVGVARVDMALMPRLQPYRAEGTAAEAAEFFNELLPGRVVTFHYGEDRGIWHERVLIWPADSQRPATRWTIATPDGDVYDEERASGADGDGPDQASLTFGATPARQRPAGRVYRFRAYPSEAELLDMVRVARCEMRASGVDVAEPATYVRNGDVLGGFTTVSFGDVLGFYRRMARKAPALAPAAGGPPSSAAPPLPASVAAPPGLGNDADDEPAGIGGPRAPPPGAAGARVLVSAEAPPPGVTWVAGKSAGTEIKRGDEILPTAGDVVWGESGLHGLPSGFIVPMGTVRDGATSTSASRWRLCDKRCWTIGERSYKWLCEYIVEHGGAADGRQTKWMSESGCAKDSAAAHFHDLLGLAIEFAQTYDQVDGSDLACMGVVARTYQLAEETMGSMKICATEQLARDAEIQKQRGKARGEKSAASGKKGQG